MRRLDDTGRAELQRYKSFANRKRSSNDEQSDAPQNVPGLFIPNPNPSSNVRPPLQPMRTNSGSSFPNRPYATGSNAIPSSTCSLQKLNDEDREILQMHHGCKKCRRCYVQHDNTNCPNDFPDPATYQRLSHEVAAAAYKASQRPGYDAFHGIDPSSAPATTMAQSFTCDGPPSIN